MAADCSFNPKDYRNALALRCEGLVSKMIDNSYLIPICESTDDPELYEMNGYLHEISDAVYFTSQKSINRK